MYWEQDNRLGKRTAGRRGRFFGAYLLGIDGSNAEKSIGVGNHWSPGKDYSSCEEDSNQIHGHVSTMTFASFAFNSFLVGFVAHTQFLNVTSAK
jgi:hypothetical protein